MSIKEFLDGLVIKYETVDFIKDDPVQFPHKFKNQADMEISALLASCLAYGKREKIIQSVKSVLEIMQNEPLNFINGFNIKKDYKLFEDFNHRYTSGIDLVLLFWSLNMILNRYSSIEDLFMQNYSNDDSNIKNALINFVEEFRKDLPDSYSPKGFYFLLPSPLKGSACKRLNLFLKWMIRKGPVDLNLWKKVSSSKLIIPLDIHVAKQSRKLGLTERKTDDWKTAEEITDKLKEFDPIDPVKYDFAIFGMGLYKDNFF